MKFLKNIFKSARKNPEIGEEVYIVSYPKSGRTWLRFLLCHYLKEKYQLPDSVGLNTMEATKLAHLSVTKFTHAQSGMAKGLTYKELPFDHDRFRDKRIILLGRNLKDTLVSAYHQATSRIKVFDGTIGEFLRDERFGIRKLMRFYTIWQENRSFPAQFLYLSYEEMSADPAAVLRSVLAFIGEDDIDEAAVASAVHHGKFDSMRKYELSMASKSSIMKPRDVDDPSSYKTRKGVVGSHREELSTEEIAYIDDIVGDFSLDSFKS